MRIRITRDTVANQEVVVAGDVVDVAEDAGVYLCRIGRAEKVDPSKVKLNRDDRAKKETATMVAKETATGAGQK
jgi:hypothetical protein